MKHTKRCGNDVRQWFRIILVVENGRECERMAVSHHCGRCDTLLPLGPSDEAPVAVEIRAAEIADWEASDEPAGCMTEHESAGFNLLSFDGPDVSEAWNAGFLARAIYDHDGEQLLSSEEQP